MALGTQQSGDRRSVVTEEDNHLIRTLTRELRATPPKPCARIRLPVRAACAGDVTEWQTLLKTLHVVSGADAGLRIMAVRSVEDEMETFGTFTSVPSSSQNGDTLVSIQDIRWYGELAMLREPSVVVEIAVPDEIDTDALVTTMTSMLVRCPGSVLSAVKVRPSAEEVPQSRLTDFVPRGVSSLYVWRPAPECNAFEVLSDTTQEPMNLEPIEPSESSGDETPESFCTEVSTEIRAYARKQTIVHGYRWSEWARARLPIRWSWIQRLGVEWRHVLQDRLQELTGLRGASSVMPAIEILSVCSCEEEMEKFVVRATTPSRPHHYTDGLSLQMSMIPTVGKVHDMQWYGELACIRDMAVVVELALSPTVAHEEFYRAVRALLSSKTARKSTPQAPNLKKHHHLDGPAVEAPRRIAAEQLHDIVPREITNMYTTGPEAVPTAPRQMILRHATDSAST